MQSARYRPPRYTTITSGRSPGFRVSKSNLPGESPSHVIRHSGRMIHFDSTTVAGASTTVAGAASELISLASRTDFSFHFAKWLLAQHLKQ